SARWIGPSCATAAFNLRATSVLLGECKRNELDRCSASFETTVARSPQDEEIPQCHLTIYLMLRSARGARHEARTVPIQPLTRARYRFRLRRRAPQPVCPRASPPPTERKAGRRRCRAGLSACRPR